MERSAGKAIRTFMSFALTASLIGIVGLQHPSSAYAEKVEASDSTNERDAVFTQSIPTQNEHFAYEYVYDNELGLFDGEYSLMTNNVVNDSFISKYDYDYALVSRISGEVFGSDVLFNPYTIATDNKINSFIPFMQNGKCGLIDFRTKQKVIPAQYDFVGIPYNEYFVFINNGSTGQGGSVSNAEAVFYRNATEISRTELVGFKDVTSANLTDFYGKSVKFFVSGDNFNDGYISKTYIKDSNDIFSIGRDIDPDEYQKTSDGRKVRFFISNGTMSFTVEDKEGVVSDPIALQVNCDNVDDCHVVANIIEVFDSNDCDTYYFTLEGKLLAGLGDYTIREFGNYITFERNNFTTNRIERVFLDTSNDCKEAQSFYRLSESISRDLYSCITEENKLQMYDTDLNLINEVDSPVDYPPKSKMRRYSIDIINDYTWVLNADEYINDEYVAIDFVIKGSSIYSLEDLGINGRRLKYCGYKCYGSENDLYVMLGQNSRAMHIFDGDLNVLKILDISNRIPQNIEDGYFYVEVRGSEEYYDPTAIFDDDDIASVHPMSKEFFYIWYSYNSERDSVNGTLVLDSSYQLMDLEFLGQYIFPECRLARLNGKFGFIDTAFNKVTEFKYDDIYAFNDFAFNNKSGYDPKHQFAIGRVGKQYTLINRDFKDVLGFAYNKIVPIAGGLYFRVEADGKNPLYDSDFQEIDMQGYQPTGQITRLPNGSDVIYATNSSGYVGALSKDGNMIIPFDYSGVSLTQHTADEISKYFVLKDSEGWFFVSTSDLVEPSGDGCEDQGHDYIKTTYATTCTLDGYDQFVCSRCGDAYVDKNTITPALGHDLFVTKQAKAATCTEEGNKEEQACTRCDYAVGGNWIPSLGHDYGYGKFETVVNPTCTEPGLERRTCTRCSMVEELPKEALGHKHQFSHFDWNDNYSSATARISCARCELSDDQDATITRESIEGGTRYTASVIYNGRNYQDGKLALEWTDKNGVSRNLLVEGEPIADGFYIDPDGLDIPEGETGDVKIDITPVTSGGVFDALVSKIGSGWPAGTYSVDLTIGDNVYHDNFGTLTISFPVGIEYAGKSATVYHCHKDDRNNITSHDLYVGEDGMVTLTGIVDLSTFALEIHEDEPATTPGQDEGNSGDNSQQGPDNSQGEPDDNSQGGQDNNSQDGQNSSQGGQDNSQGGQNDQSQRTQDNDSQRISDPEQDASNLGSGSLAQTGDSQGSTLFMALLISLLACCMFVSAARFIRTRD